MPDSSVASWVEKAYRGICIARIISKLSRTDRAVGKHSLGRFEIIGRAAIEIKELEWPLLQGRESLQRDLRVLEVKFFERGHLGEMLDAGIGDRTFALAQAAYPNFF